MAASRCFLLLLLLLLSPLLASAGEEEEEAVLAMAARLRRPAAASFREGYTQLFGDSNLALHGDGKRVRISLDERTGAGFASQDAYLHGFFSASIKLPPDYAAGVVVAFYMSNGDVYEKTHDELDFEFLGNIKGREWRVQTNVYGNGSTSVGREERFYIDETPIREVQRTKSMGVQFPSKPMSLYATIWDGSSWATSGGRYKVNYKYAPFVAEFSELMLHGCAMDTLTRAPMCTPDIANIHNAVAMSGRQRSAMERFRTKYMTYGYCYDRLRYPTPPSECNVGPEAELFLPTGEARSIDRHGRARRHRRGPADSAF
ncbi:hypothetical protein OsJ_30538 [Oryza sativa Japonica Group]|uniref:Xyloglucan endotransglucosylase/hydrolase n=4 Tax=Oryza TaxID=4527 RepID=A0A9K3Y836_ORYSJ|nr:Putative xyloglucan endo-transglycosylase [Oryza sativa]AAP51883.1 Glycosyl hydrolases family 16 protein, expressed [Oryza sativa Japonica Group]EAZ15125.1 hypothetical protein OsJ_30538 [Oryza sativa Japonica Group]